MNVNVKTRRIPNRQFVTLPEVAELRGVSRVAILYAIRSGRLRAHRSPGSRQWLIHVDDARAYLEETAPAPVAPPAVELAS